MGPGKDRGNLPRSDMETERVIKQGGPLNIAVIGVGGVGGYFGGKLTTLLSRNRDLKIYFIARNEHSEGNTKKRPAPGNG